MDDDEEVDDTETLVDASAGARADAMEELPGRRFWAQTINTEGRFPAGLLPPSRQIAAGTSS